MRSPLMVERIGMSSILLALVLAACHSATGPNTAPIRASEPMQFMLAAPPDVYMLPDSSRVVFKAIAPDSTPHVLWRPTDLFVETEDGFQRVLRLNPFDCVKVINPASKFPYSMDWETCDRIVFDVVQVLDSTQLRSVEQMVDGTTVWHWYFSSWPGAEYVLRVPLGYASTTEAMRRVGAWLDQTFGPGRFLDSARTLPEGVGHYPSYPWCYLSDEVPPPPCPRWYLANSLPLGGDSGGFELVPGEWIRVIYHQPDGSTVSTFKVLR